MNCKLVVISELIGCPNNTFKRSIVQKNAHKEGENANNGMYILTITLRIKGNQNLQHFLLVESILKIISLGSDVVMEKYFSFLFPPKF